MQLKETTLAAAALALVATSANAGPHHRDHRPLRIVIETVDHQRYPTAGDWQLKPDGLHIFVSRMSDQRYEFLVGMHEVIEAYLCKQAGVTQAAVDRFDQAYEHRRKPGDSSEPGDDPKAPYHLAHVFATKVERMLADQLDVNWSTYDHEASSK
jgi:hypothetical protein